MAEQQPSHDDSANQRLVADARAQVENADYRPVSNFSLPGYELVREVYRGGQGVVYEAVQVSTRRTVAIKVLREGPFAGPADRIRFDREVQILGSLRHPNIVTIHDSGSMFGCFYYVMDFIPGQPLDDWAAGVRTSGTDRRANHERLLGVALKICDAVTAAHQRGIIHRDLKPNNIRIDDNDEPHVLDFGLAKVAGLDPHGETSSLTATGQFLGTLPWASPEQAGGDAHGVDVRGDVYALGLMLYQGLTGRMPYNTETNVRDLVTAIIEHEPTRPSSTGTFVDDDLETIVLKCLNKAPDRRYQTAAALAADLRRYGAGEPIEARRNSGLYLLRMFTRRHRGAVLAAGLFILFLITSSATLAYMYVQQTWLRELAEQSEQSAHDTARFQSEQLAHVNAARMGAQLRSDLLKRAEAAAVSAGLDQDEIQERTAALQRGLAGVNFTDLALHTLDQNILQPALETIDSEFATRPEIRTRLLETTAKTINRLGLVERGIDPQTKVVQLCAEALGESHPDTLTASNALTVMLSSAGRLDAARARAEDTLAKCRDRLGSQHSVTLGALHAMGAVLKAQGDFDQALPAYQAAVDGRRAALGNEHPETIDSINGLGMLLMDMRRDADGLPYVQEVLDVRRRVLGAEHPETLHALNNLAAAYYGLGRIEEAVDVLTEALQVTRLIQGNEHPDTLVLAHNLGYLLKALGRLDPALKLFRETTDTRRATLGPEHPKTLNSINNLAGTLKRMGRLDEAMKLQQEALEVCVRRLGEDHLFTLRARHGLAVLLQDLGRLNESMEHLSDTLARQRRVLGDRHAETVISLANMGHLLRLMHRYEESLAHYQEAWTISTETRGTDHQHSLTFMRHVGDLLRTLGRLDAAESHVARTLELTRSALGEDASETLTAREALGRLRAAQGNLAEALEIHSDALADRKRLHGDDHPMTLRSMLEVGALLTDLRCFDEAEPLLLHAAVRIDRISASHTLHAQVADQLARLYESKHAADLEGMTGAERRSKEQAAAQP